MVSLDISIASWYSLKGNFEHYYVDYLVDGGKVDYLPSDVKAPRRFGGTFVNGREITDYFLSEYDFSGENKPKVIIDLWVGVHPLESCPQGCLHARYTKRPEESILEDLKGIL